MGKRIIVIILKILGHLIAIFILGLVFWSKIYPWLFNKGFMGWDTAQFIYYVSYYTKHLSWPHISWDYQWFMGIPRPLDATFLHFYLIEILINQVGMWMAIKIYPVISFALFIILSYFIFYLISRNIFVSLGLAISVAASRALYSPLFDGGVVLSAISQFAFPLSLLFLICFYQTKKTKYLYLGGLAGALGLYSHGGTQLIFGVFPSMLFLLLATHEGEKLITVRSFLNSVKYFLVVIFVGALASWPQLAEALKAGSYGTALLRDTFRSIEPQTTTFRLMWDLVDKSVYLILIYSVILALLSFRKRKPVRIFVPLLALFIYGLIWNITSFWGFNPWGAFLFPGRIMWFFPITVGAVSAALLKKQHLFLKIVVLGISLFFVFGLITKIKFENIKPYVLDIYKSNTENFAYIGNFVRAEDRENMNYRLWSHDGGVNNTWGVSYKMPQFEGYFHFYTKEAEPWQGWFYGVISRSNWLKEEIPPEMAKSQARFFIDWYAIKYLVTGVGSELLDIAPYYYEDTSDLFVRKDVIPQYPGLFEVDNKYTSPIIEAVRVPTIGFIGDTSGYNSFLKNIASLGLDTHYLIPVKISQSIGSLCRKTIDVDSLVLYNFSESAFSSCGWNTIENFVKEGGKVWVETAGDSEIRESKDLPAVFPVTSTHYGSLDKNWQSGGELSSKIEFSLLEPLVYRGDPWKFSYANENEIKEEAKVLLSQKGKPVVVERNMGKGKVIWSGVNFWYRPEEYRKNGMQEVKPIGVILSRLINLVRNETAAKIERISPERAEILGKDFSGIVFKENYSTGWSARVERNGKKIKIPILIAGPGLMYINIPPALRKGDIKVHLIYEGELLHWLALFVTIISIIIAIDLILGGHIVSKFGFNKLGKRIKNWWKDENEN